MTFLKDESTHPFSICPFCWQDGYRAFRQGRTNSDLELANLRGDHYFSWLSGWESAFDADITRQNILFHAELD